MPDNSTNALSGLYPQPPAQQGGNALLSNPLALIAAANQANALAQFHGRQGAAQAGINALNPDGSLDAGKYVRGLQADPSIAAGGQEVIGSMLDQRGKDIANSSAAFNLAAGQNDYMLSKLGAMGDDPNLTHDKVRGTTVNMVRAGLAAPVPAVAWLRTMPPESAGNQALQQWVRSQQNIAMGAAGVAVRTEGPVTSAGATTTQTMGQANQAAAGAPQSPSRLTVTALPAGAKEAKTAVGQVSGQQFASDLNESATYRRSVYPLEQAIPALEKLGKTGTGPGTSELNQVKSFLQSLGAPGFDADKIKTFDEANKYLTDFVNQTGNSGTNDKLAAAFAGNPSVHISNAAAVDVAKSALALRRMKQAQVAQFQSTGLPDDQYSRWASRWIGQQDPRAFGFDNMSAAAQQKLLGSLKGDERVQFLASLRAAHTSGVLSRPQDQNGGQ